MTETGWVRVKPKDLEELTFWLLQREGFFNVTWHGESGGDKGRDLTCQRSEVFGSRVMIYDCVVQCKKYGGRVSRSKLYEDILKASEHRPDYFILVTTGIVESSTKDWLNSQQDNFAFRLVLWERTDLEVLLERHQDLRSRFLGVAMDPNLLLKQIASESHSLSGADKVLLTPIVRRTVARAYEMAIKHSHLVTIGHLLTALLRTDRVCTRPLFLKHGVEPERLAKVLEDTFVKQQPQERANSESPQLSASVRLAFETALRVMQAVRESVLSERILVSVYQPLDGAAG